MRFPGKVDSDPCFYFGNPASHSSTVCDNEVALWRAGERPQLRQTVLEGDVGLSA